MIDHITGNITAVSDKAVTVEVGPLGLSILVANSTLFAIGNSQKLYLHMHWNQEHGPSFYGFVHEYERGLFLLVTSCSGIGPKIGLAILASIGAAQFLQAVQEENPKFLSQVPGIGLKKAEQIIVNLKHKVADLLLTGIDSPIAKTGNDWHSVTQALESLNYSRAEISAAMHHIRQRQADGQITSFDLLLRQALSFLAKQV